MKTSFGWATAIGLVAVLFAGTARAGPYTEVGDSGELPATAQTLPGGTTSIIGEIGSGSDADLFRFTWGGGTFDATTVGTPGTLFDPQLFLFDASANGITGNDDVSLSDLNATISASLAPGEYFIGISAFDIDPGNSSGEIFTDNFPGTQTPTGPGGPGPLTGWSGSNFWQQHGTYTIEFRSATAAPVPEPGSMALLGLGIAGIFSRRKRRRRARS